MSQSGHGEHDQPLSAYVGARRVGEAVVTVISEGGLSWAPKFAIPDEEWRRVAPNADEAGRVPLGLNLVLIQLGDATILLDPGCDDPDSDWQQGFAKRFHAVHRTPGLTKALEGVGVTPEEVTHVLITHAHGDHLAGITVERDGRMAPRFPNARHVISRLEVDRERGRPNSQPEVVTALDVVEQSGLLETVEGETEIVPGVTMIPAPGETPGHMVVRLRSGGESFYYVGDLFHHAAEIEHLDWVSPYRDAAAMIASREQLIAEAAPSNAIVVFAHDQFPAWGRIVPAPGGTGWHWMRV